MIELTRLVSYLDDYLDTAGFIDYAGALNGLQVANSGSVGVIAAATDACLETIGGAAERGADLMLVHHGLFWGRGLAPVTGPRYRRMKEVLTADLAIYSSHLPLDAHPEVGNNIGLARLLELRNLRRFGELEGREIGFIGEAGVAREELGFRLAELLNHTPVVVPGGPELCSRIGIITGGGSDMIAEAQAAGADTFITGEGPHHTYNEAVELGINVIYAGHYATETLGVKALAAHVAAEFDLEWEFIDHPTGL